MLLKWSVYSGADKSQEILITEGKQVDIGKFRIIIDRKTWVGVPATTEIVLFFFFTRQQPENVKMYKLQYSHTHKIV